MSIKRKVRDAIQFQIDEGILPAEHNRIFIRRESHLTPNSRTRTTPWQRRRVKNVKGDSVAKAGSYMVENYFDVRMFGAVMSTGNASAGKITGPVTIGIARARSTRSSPSTSVSRVRPPPRRRIGTTPRWAARL